MMVTKGPLLGWRARDGGREWGGDGESGGWGRSWVNANGFYRTPTHSPPAVEGKGGFKLFFPFV